VKLTDKVVIITGAANGIGAALARRIAAERPTGIVLSDIDAAGLESVADSIRAIGGQAVTQVADATSKEQMRALVARARQEFGGVHVFCSNAGVAFGTGLLAADEQWLKSWQLNVMQHVYAAQACVALMQRQGEGYLLLTASGAGLLGVPGDAPYTVTKHAEVALAEWLAYTYRPKGIRVSALCPLGVRTSLLMPGVAAGHPSALAIAAAADLLEPEEVAEMTVAGMDREDFLILPHPTVADRYAAKAQNVDAWIDQTIAAAGQ